MAESCQFQPYTGSNCRKKKGWPWGVAESSLAHSDGVWRQISVDFQMDILAFVLSAVTSNLLSGCRSANRGPQEPLWWEIPNTRAQCLLVGRQALPWGDHNPDSAWLPQAGQVRVQSRTQTSMFSHQCYCYNICQIFCITAMPPFSRKILRAGWGKWFAYLKVKKKKSKVCYWSQENLNQLLHQAVPTEEMRRHQKY